MFIYLGQKKELCMIHIASSYKNNLIIVFKIYLWHLKLYEPKDITVHFRHASIYTS